MHEPLASADVAPPRLRIVVPRFGDGIVGGAEAYAAQLAHSLHAAGWDISIWTTTAEDEATWAGGLSPGDGRESGLRVRRFAVARRRKPRAFALGSKVFFRIPGRLRPEAWWIREQGPVSPGLVAALRAEPRTPSLFIPYLYQPTLAGLPCVTGPGILIPAAHDELPLRLRAVRRVVSRAALWYATPEERELVERIHPIAAARPHETGTVGVVAPPDADGRRFRQQFGLDARPYFLYGGRATPGKGMEVLVDGIATAHSRDPAARLLVIGAAARALRGKPGVVAVGIVNDALRWDAICGSCGVVVPSAHESLSLLALEAWAVGRPALLNARSPVLAGQAERSGGGVLFDGAGDLADQMLALLRDPRRGDALGRRGRAHVDAMYRWAAVHERLARLLAQRDVPTPSARCYPAAT